MKLTAAIAASYFGAEVICAPYGGQPERKITGTMIGLNNYGIDIKFPEWQSPHQIAIDKCQLLLTPISKISDGDAVEVAKMFSWFNHYNGKEIEAYKNQFGKTVVSNKERIGKYETVCLDFDNPELLNKQQVDYLRSKSYDIDNLIAAGVAVGKKEI